MDHIVQPAVATSEAYRLGVTRGELAGPRWAAPHRGVRLPAGSAASDPLQRIYAAAELLPAGAALGGWAAAYLLGATELDGRGANGRGSEPVPLVLSPPTRIRPRRGIALWRSRLDDEDVRVVDGIAVTSPPRTAFDLARRGPLTAAVVALDQLGRQLRLDPATVMGYARSRRRWRGRPNALDALELTDPRALSPGETRLRLLWVIDAGLPAPEPNASVFSLNGDLLGQTDLLDPAAGLVGEYDGGSHRALESHSADNAREEWLEDAGLVVVRATSVDVGPQRRRTVHRLQTAHRRATARDRVGERWFWRPAPRPWDGARA